MSGAFFGHADAGHSSAQGLDAKLEHLALDHGLPAQLGEDQDTFNSETFSADASEITGREFDFFHNTQVRLQTPAAAVDERQATPQARLEAKPVSSLRKQADAQTIAWRRAARLERQAALAKYDGMMSRRDKEYIIRIQISQLLTDDPAADDFYCHMFQLSRGAQAGASAGTPAVARVVSEAMQGAAGRGVAGGRAQTSMARMQQQVQRIVNEAKRRPKVAHVAPQGALGRISVQSARNPKQAIQVQRGRAGSMGPAGPDPGGVFSGLAAERRKTLGAVEAVYANVLRLEQLLREQARLPAGSGGDHPAVQRWVAEYSVAKDAAWTALDAAQPILAIYPHPLVRFLAVSKGKRIIPRLVHHLSLDQVLALTTTIIANFESLDVCRYGSFGSPAVGARQRDETDLFLHAVMPPVLAFLADASLQIVNGLFALFMERNNIAWVARTRPALVFLTVLLARTAALRRSASEDLGQDLYQASELYAHLFTSLRGAFAAIFPPQPPVLGQLPDPVGDIHAWRFLSTMAAAATVEQQHELVAEVRERVLERVQLAKSGRVSANVASAITANVNLFLNALGLDASQVTT